MNHIFHLGRNPELSILEIISYLDRTKTKYKVEKITKKVLIIESTSFNAKKAITALGGTVKISIPINKEEIEKNILDLYTKKLSYGINSIESSNSNTILLNETIRNFCKKNKIKSFHKYIKERDIPPSKSTNLDLEFTLYKNKNYFVSATSNPKAYEERDENRPFFNPLKVTSLRLAKILINLAQPKKQAVILDPFAGLGTILQEALLMGFKIAGADIKSSAVKKCKSNLRWIKSKYKVKSEYSIHHSEILHLSERITEADCIVTEPYLGPFLRKLPGELEARRIAKELNELYSDILRESSNILKKGSKMVIIVPAFKTKNNKNIRIGFQSLIEPNGFRIFQPLNNKLIPIEYRLKSSKIRRKIYILEKFK
jgi:tRNA G10  N-methylase Trm11